MRLKNIELHNYRNYSDFIFDFQNKKTLIIGKNAQGKTNLLEAIFYLSSLNSNRINKDMELIGFGCDYTSIKATVIKEDYEIELEVIINPPKKKILKVNSIKKSKSKDFLRVLSVVNFCVEDLLLLRGEPSNRRHWLDNAICQIYPLYDEKLSKYNKIRLQKSNFLSQFDGNFEMLDVFNTQLSVAGANVIYLRQKFLSQIGRIATLKHTEIASSETLSLEYNSFVENTEKFSPQELTQKLYEKLQEVKSDEIRRCQCLVGPHRDDISFYINGIDAKKFASQGQQRTIVLALKLAELEIIKEKNNDLPLLLLDDVLAELDNIRQNYLLNAVGDDVQTIITSVDTLAFDEKFLKNVEIIKIKEGRLEK